MQCLSLLLINALSVMVVGATVDSPMIHNELWTGIGMKQGLLSLPLFS